MTTTSATSSIVSTLGGGSGIDMAALAASLAEAQFATKIERLTTKSETLETQISAASSLKSMILELASSVGERVREGDLSSQPVISNSSVATVSAGSATGAGSYSLEVTALARAQTLTSPAYASAATTTGSGTLTLRFGTISGTSFTEDTAHAAVAITVASGATLTDVAAAINAADAGVTAYVANGADGAHLMLKGQEGAANAFILEASETVGEEGLANLAWTPAVVSTRLLSSSASAAFKLDGLAMTSASNTITDVAPGLSLKLTGTNTGSPTTISFSDASSSITTFMQDLVSALNELVAELNTDTDSKTGELARDPGARALRSALSALAGTTVMPGAVDGEPSTLSELGLATNRDGTFRLDSSRLAATLKASPSGAAAMFTTGVNGVFATLDRISRNATSASDPGSLTGSVNRYTTLQTDTTEEQEELAEAQESLRARLTARFAAVDSRVAASKSTLAFLKNQIAAWNASSD